jgi:hypothetical protein
LGDGCCCRAGADRWPGWASKKRLAVRLLTAGNYYIKTPLLPPVRIYTDKGFNGSVELNSTLYSTLLFFNRI